MKFPQIFTLLALLGLFGTFACRDTKIKDEKAPEQEINVPSAEEHRRPKTTPNKNIPKPAIKSRDSLLKKQKKYKDLDTLKPKVALLKS